MRKSLQVGHINLKNKSGKLVNILIIMPLTDEEVPKTDRLKAGFLRLCWAGCDPEWVRSVSGDQSSGAICEVVTSERRLSPILSATLTSFQF